ncbi:hypothetical protein GMLC_05150 [Geomonas limicola]|uniref:Uncharacterized protein n=1 Tax=Geomonas limicola TaxID=2740186 RepID=A0A6V8N355_9BACT|nr:hypothetical protein [Geomonas limicola]GFO66936.1 hypothetical protein GMLC_05150 [Geomonas limicola]
MIEQVERIVADYEARGREPQRVLEVIACLSHDVEEEPEAAFGVFPKIAQIVAGWEQGARSALDALETIAALIRQEQQHAM